MSRWLTVCCETLSLCVCTHTHSPSLVLVAVMKPKELKTKIYSHADSLIPSHSVSGVDVGQTLLQSNNTLTTRLDQLTADHQTQVYPLTVCLVQADPT